nr:hypothetical protein [uncultured Flavobacterium sp.]
MAKSDNFFEINGKIGKLVFYKRNGKNFVKENKGGFAHDNVKNNPNVKATRTSFGALSSFASKLRKALTPYIQHQKDPNFYHILQSFLKQIIDQQYNKNLTDFINDPNRFATVHHQNLNKNNKIQLLHAYYNSTTQEVIIQQHHIAYLLKLHPKSVLACRVGFCNLYSQEVITTTPPLIYFLEENKTRTITDKIKLALPKPTDQPNAVVFISIVVIDSPTEHANTKDAYKSMGACFIPTQETDRLK